MNQKESPFAAFIQVQKAVLQILDHSYKHGSPVIFAGLGTVTSYLCELKKLADMDTGGLEIGKLLRVNIYLNPPTDLTATHEALGVIRGVLAGYDDPITKELELSVVEPGCVAFEIVVTQQLVDFVEQPFFESFVKD